MKILFHHRTRSKDGQDVHITELTRALRERGHEILIVGPQAMEASAFGADAGPVAMLKRLLPRLVYELLELAYSWPAYRRLRRACSTFRPDCLYERYNLFLPSGVWLKRRYGLPMLSEVNAPIAEERARFDGLALRRLAAWSERFVWRNADYVLPVTDVLAGYVRRAGVPEARIAVIPNGIDRRRFRAPDDSEAAKARFGLEGRLVLGFTGFLRAWHGLERVVDFIADSDPALNLHFLIVGDGPAREDVEARAQARGVAERVTFAGIVGRDAVADHIAAFDVALQPDVTDYASPLKLFEYMAMGCAIVAPDKANIREVLRDGTNGILFDAADPGAFRAALERLCRDPALCRRIGDAASRTIDAQGFTWANNARRVEALFRERLGADCGTAARPETVGDDARV